MANVMCAVAAETPEGAPKNPPTIARSVGPGNGQVRQASAHRVSSTHLEDALASLIRLAVREELQPLVAALSDLRAQTVDRALLPLPEAANQLGISIRTLRRRIRDGSVPAVRLGSAVRIDMRALRASSSSDVEQRSRNLLDPLAC